MQIFVPFFNKIFIKFFFIKLFIIYIFYKIIVFIWYVLIFAKMSLCVSFQNYRDANI